MDEQEIQQKLTEIKRDFSNLENLEADYETSLGQLENLLGELQYWFKEEIYQQYREALNQTNSAAKKFAKEGELVHDKLEQMREFLSEEQWVDLCEEFPYPAECSGGGWEVCRCVVCFTCLSGRDEWFEKEGEKLEEEYFRELKKYEEENEEG